MSHSFSQNFFYLEKMISANKQILKKFSLFLRTSRDVCSLSELFFTFRHSPLVLQLYDLFDVHDININSRQKAIFASLFSYKTTQICFSLYSLCSAILAQSNSYIWERNYAMPKPKYMVNYVMYFITTKIYDCSFALHLVWCWSHDHHT